jgi:general secretion pathway protein J
MAGLAWRGIDGIVRSRDVSQSRLEQSLRLNTVLAQWEQDLQSIQETPAAPALTFDGGTLRLTRHQAQGMQVVAWSLRGDGNRGVIQRWAGPVTANRTDLQEQWLATQQFLGNETGQLRALEGVSGWQIYFFRNNAWSNAQSSADVVPLPVANPASAPTAVRHVLPSAVRLVVNFAEGSGLAGSLTRDIALGPQQP